jgi:hypothetical protein
MLILAGDKKLDGSLPGQHPYTGNGFILKLKRFEGGKPFHTAEVPQKRPKQEFKLFECPARGYKHP